MEAERHGISFECTMDLFWISLFCRRYERSLEIMRLSQDRWSSDELNYYLRSVSTQIAMEQHQEQNSLIAMIQNHGASPILNESLNAIKAFLCRQNLPDYTLLSPLDIAIILDLGSDAILQFARNHYVGAQSLDF